MSRATLLVLAVATLVGAHGPASTPGPSVEVAFTVKQKDLIPEGIAHDPADGRFYLGSIRWKKIVRVASDGTAADFTSSGQDGLGEVLGLRVDPSARQIWACSNVGEGRPGGRSSVHRFDLRTGALVRKYELAPSNDAHFFNDLVVLGSGDAFVTDTYGGAVYRIAKDGAAPELFLKSDALGGANGIAATADEGRLVVSGQRGLVFVDLASRAVKRVESLGYLIIADGLYRHGRSLIAVQNVFFPVSVVRYDLDEAFTAIREARVLASDHPAFSIPTTGVVVGDDFYFIANSHVDEISGGQIAHPERLREVVVLRTPIRP
jgi:hypothetical protein